MKKILNKLFASKEKWEFQKAELEEAEIRGKNPARGWYTIYPFFLEKEPDFEELYWCLAKEETLALVIINIGAYQERALDETALQRLCRILAFFERHSYDVILRITYDHEGNAVEREPFFFKQVLEHMRQLVPVVKEFSATVFIWQGILIGNWGEMHTSRFLSEDKMKQLWEIMRTGLENKIFQAVRRPCMWRMLHPKARDKKQWSMESTGLFDDAIFGSESHMGTFGTESREHSGWENLWCREDELAFEEELCKYVPNGGEVVCGEEYEKLFTPETSLEVLKQMHVTYLNKAYDEKILQQWKVWQYKNTGFYEYVGNHLGYCFCIRNVELISDLKKDGLQIKIAIENIGFANCYFEANVQLEYKKDSGEQQCLNVETDVRTWDSGKTKQICCVTDRVEGDIYLSVRRKKDDRIVWFANQADGYGRVFLGKLVKN